MRILFTGGGTGGHLFPIVAVARQLKKINLQSPQPIGPGQETILEMYFLGAKGFSDVLKKEEIKTRAILAGKLRRYFSFQIILDILKIPIGFIQSLIYLYIWMPDVIFSKGGYGSVSVVLVAWLFRIPVLTHESDTVPGLANRLGAKFSRRIAVSFTSAGKYFPTPKTALTGNPVREKIIQICTSTDPALKERSRNFLGLSGQKPVILVLGGSQGARMLNEAVIKILPQLLEKYEVFHQCGLNNFEEVKNKTSQIPSLNDYHIYPFLNEEQYAAAQLSADLVISRAGAGSIAEIAACGKPSVLIPLPNAAANHQKENAFVYAKAGATVVIEQGNLTPSIFLNEINQILSNPELSQKMSVNARNFSQPEAARKIAVALIEMGK